MDQLKETILEKGKILSPSILKVDQFLNHCIDTELMDAIGKRFADCFAGHGITKVITIESGGIAPALMTAVHMGVPLIFAKKAVPSTMTDPVFVTVHSFTKNVDYTLCMERSLIAPGDRVLFIDDFLANGQAFEGIRTLLEQQQAGLAGAGICIEKSWQPGRRIVEEASIPLCTLASIASMSPEEGITWNLDHETC